MIIFCIIQKCLQNLTLGAGYGGPGAAKKTAGTKRKVPDEEKLADAQNEADAIDWVVRFSIFLSSSVYFLERNVLLK